MTNQSPSDNKRYGLLAGAIVIAAILISVTIFGVSDMGVKVTTTTTETTTETTTLTALSTTLQTPTSSVYSGIFEVNITYSGEWHATVLGGEGAPITAKVETYQANFTSVGDATIYIPEGPLYKTSYSFLVSVNGSAYYPVNNPGCVSNIYVLVQKLDAGTGNLTVYVGNGSGGTNGSTAIVHGSVTLSMGTGACGGVGSL